MVENNLPEYFCTLSAELQQRAEAELNERPQWRDRDVLALRQMVLESPDLRCPTDYQFLLRFLRAKKFDYDRAFACLRRYYDARGKHPEIFNNFLPSSIQKVLDSGIVVVLPIPDAKGRRVVWLRPGLWDPDTMPVTDILKALLLSLDWLVRDETVQINGITLLEDFVGVGWKQFRHMNRDRIRTMTFIVQEAFPVRLKAVHIMNAPAYMQYFLTVVRLFLKEKLRERIRVHGGRYHGVIEDLGEEAVPVQYGGKLVVDPCKWRNELVTPDVESYFKSRLGEGYVDAARKMTDGGRRLSANSLTFAGSLPLLGPAVEQSPCVVQVDTYESTMAFTSLSVCQASTDSD